jgi:hypothetical protein
MCANADSCEARGPMSAAVFSSDPGVHRRIIAAGRGISRRRPIAFRCPTSGPRGRRAQRACDHEAQCFGSSTPRGIYPPLGGRGQSDNWQKSCRRNGPDPLNSQQYDCDRSRLVRSCRQKSTRSHHACPRRTTPLSCDVRRQVVKGPLHSSSGLPRYLALGERKRLLALATNRSQTSTGYHAYRAVPLPA